MSADTYLTTLDGFAHRVDDLDPICGAPRPPFPDDLLRLCRKPLALLTDPTYRMPPAVACPDCMLADAVAARGEGTLL